MSRLEIISDHFIKHEVRFTVGKDTVKVVPVFEFSDGAVEMNFGGISVVPDVPETTGVILSKPVKYGVAFVNDPAVKTLWSSFDLLPQVSYKMEFTADGALPHAKLVFRDSGRKVLTALPIAIVKGVNKCVTLFVTKGQRLVIGIIINSRGEKNLCTVAFGCLDFRDRCSVGKADNCFYSAFLCGEGNTLSVITRRTGHHSPFLFLGGKL